KEGSRCYEVDIDGRKANWTFSGLSPEAGTEEGREIAAQLRDRLSAFATSVRWLGAVRSAVPRYFEMRPDSDGLIGPDGLGVAEAIRISAAAGDGAAEAVSKWLELTCQCSLSFAASEGS